VAYLVATLPPRCQLGGRLEALVHKAPRRLCQLCHLFSLKKMEINKYSYTHIYGFFQTGGNGGRGGRNRSCLGRRPLVGVEVHEG